MYALTSDTFSVTFLTKHNLYHVFMQQRYLSALTGIGIVLVGGIFLVWSKKTQRVPPQSQTLALAEEAVKTPKVERLDTSDWKTYQNKTYGFIVRYPATWSAKEFYSAGYGMPIDCQKIQRSKECPNFGVVFSPMSHDNLKTSSVVLDTFSQKTNRSVKNDDRTEETASWKKMTDVGTEYFKNNSYFPLYGSCWTQANIPHVSLKGGIGFYFSTFYEVPGDIYIDAAEKFCSQEIPDLIFDAIVESFRPI